MNTFKAIVLLCAVLGASCTQHMYNQRGWESPARPSTGASAYGGAQKQTQNWSTPATEAPTNAYQAAAPAPEAPANAYGQSAPAATSSSSKKEAAAPATVHQICSCTIIPDAPKAPEAAPIAPAKTEAAAAVQSYGAASAPAQKPAYSAAPAAEQKPIYSAAPATAAPAYSRGPATSAYQRPAAVAYPATTSY